MTQRCVTCGKPIGKTRSERENKYYWPVVVGIISDVTGNSPNVVHEFLKSEHGSKQVALFNGKEFHVPKSTTEMLTTEFEDYMSRCRVWASEQGWFIPLPNEGIRK